MSSPSRPNWQSGDGTGRYTALFSFEHLPIHTQTIGAMHLGLWEASYSWDGGIWRKLFDEP